ncbi:MAG: hypothetical protein IJI25_12265 [Eubacterium sp.]|nr:hypothetical protein [Eubacterium sp.]
MSESDFAPQEIKKQQPPFNFNFRGATELADIYAPSAAFTWQNQKHPYKSTFVKSPYLRYNTSKERTLQHIKRNNCLYNIIVHCP